MRVICLLTLHIIIYLWSQKSSSYIYYTDIIIICEIRRGDKIFCCYSTQFFLTISFSNFLKCNKKSSFQEDAFFLNKKLQCCLVYSPLSLVARRITGESKLVCAPGITIAMFLCRFPWQAEHVLGLHTFQAFLRECKLFRRSLFVEFVFSVQQQLEMKLAFLK